MVKEGGMMYRILIVEDNEKISLQLYTLLQREGYQPEIVTDFQNIVDVVLSSNPHLLLLDLNLPYEDGYYICKELRKKVQLPIIVVTSRETEMDELMSMNMGADDFVTKPYNVNILLARIQNLLKRAYPDNQQSILTYGNIMLNVNKSSVTCDHREIELTKNEFRILYFFMKNSGKIVTREELMTYLWDSDVFVDDNTLTVNVNRLRKKLDLVGGEPKIKTKRGVGYSI